MSIYDIDGSCTTVTDYDILIDSEYYNQDYDDVDWEPIDNELNKPQTDILFE